MNRRQLLRSGVIFLMALWTGTSLAHGLHMTTAEVTQRQEDHLIVTIRTSPSNLFNRMQYQGKPSSVIYLANGSDEEVGRFREQLLALLRDGMRIAVGQQPLQSMQVRTISAEALRKLLLEDIAVHVLQAGAPDGLGGGGRQTYLHIEIDGFLPAGDGPGMLQATFPKELGPIMVSYTKPQIQTIAPDEQGSHYLQMLK